VALPIILADVNPTWLLLAGIAILTSVLVRLTYRRSRRHRPSIAAAGSSGPPGTPSASYRDLLRRLEEKEVEFEELSRSAMARLDNKIAILQRLLAESEQAIARLQEVRQNGRS
jgi:hypothetical protein